MKKLFLSQAIFFSVTAFAQVDPAKIRPIRGLGSCSGSINQMMASSLGGQRSTSTIFNHNGGTFDPAPLLSSSFTSTEGCVIIHFSANTYVADNNVLYQVRIDGQPAEGHISSVITTIDNSAAPVIIVPDEDGPGTKVWRSQSYTFFAKVKAGAHKVEVMTAACCSANTSGSTVLVADNATLVVQYNK